MTANSVKRIVRSGLPAAAGGLLISATSSWTSTAPPPNSISVTFNGQLTGQGSFVIPQPVTFSGQLAAQGSIVVPQPVEFNGSLSAQGSFLGPRVPQPGTTLPKPSRTQ
jgi:hypothetical protein